MLEDYALEVDRRLLLVGTMSIAATAFLWGCAKDNGTINLSFGQMKILAQITDLVLPRTNTPGAVDVGVPAFVALAFAHGMGGTADPKSPGAPPDNDYGLWLENNFGRDPTVTLPAIDIAAYAEGAPPSPWKTVKALILTGYFTSQAGATRALRYELTPGRFDPNIPLRAGDKGWASDWIAAEFG